MAPGHLPSLTPAERCRRRGSRAVADFRPFLMSRATRTQTGGQGDTAVGYCGKVEQESSHVHWYWRFVVFF